MTSALKRDRATLQRKLPPAGEREPAPPPNSASEQELVERLTRAFETGAAEMGLLIVRIAQAIESLPHIARAHVSRWGDGGAHLHVFFFARPAGFLQLRGTCLAIWDDLLPAGPPGQRDSDAASVAQALADSYGGRPHPATMGAKPARSPAE